MEDLKMTKVNTGDVIYINSDDSNCLYTMDNEGNIISLDFDNVIINEQLKLLYKAFITYVKDASCLDKEKFESKYHIKIKNNDNIYLQFTQLTPQQLIQYAQQVVFEKGDEVIYQNNKGVIIKLYTTVAEVVFENYNVVKLPLEKLEKTGLNYAWITNLI